MLTRSNSVYYVEDDADIAEAVVRHLRNSGFSCAVLETADAARRALSERQPDIVLLDWNMPDGQGDDLCQWLRARWSDLPILFLTARDSSKDMIAGFRCGADDYVVKPFDLEVLTSRIRALLRRADPSKTACLRCGRLTLNADDGRVAYEGEEIELSQAEYQLLYQLLLNKGRTVTRQQLLERNWDAHGNFVNDNTLTVTMKRLREKLRNPPFLKTVRSFGYRAEDEV